MNTTYEQIAAELKATLQALIAELNTIEEKSQKTSGKRARVLTTDLKKVTKSWKLALKEREAAYPKKEKKTKAE